MKFSKEFLQDMGGKTVQESIVCHDRWTVGYERIFEHEGKFYLTFFTEQQGQRPYEYDNDEIECKEVKAVVKSITVYE